MKSAKYKLDYIKVLRIVILTGIPRGPCFPGREDEEQPCWVVEFVCWIAKTLDAGLQIISCSFAFSNAWQQQNKKINGNNLISFISSENFPKQIKVSMMCFWQRSIQTQFSNHVY